MAVALKDGFSLEGYEVVQAFDGEAALKLAQETDPDLMILDVMLPKMNGLDVCKKLRAGGDDVPIIMLTARGRELDKVLGLKLGADDYVTKPFSLAELLARAETILRRVNGKSAGSLLEDTFEFDEIRVDLQHHEVFRDGEPMKISSKEFMLLRYFIEHRGEVVTREQLLEDVWGYESSPYTRTVDTHIAKLRKKIEADPADPRRLITLHGMGYKFCP